MKRQYILNLKKSFPEMEDWELERVAKASGEILEVLKESGLTYRQLEMTFSHLLDRLKDVSVLI